jgi:hypothetical protein
MTHSARDHALTLKKAGPNLIPVVGGALASLIGDYVPTSTQWPIIAVVRLVAAPPRLARWVAAQPDHGAAPRFALLLY